MSEYAEFLRRKQPEIPASAVAPQPVHEMLYPFQRAITEWAIRRGRAAVFADCGLGKTFIQLEWARQMGGRVLIVAPLAVTHQTIVEAKRIGMTVEYCTEPQDGPGYQITNYERLPAFVGAPFDAIVLDESSILKSLDGKTRRLILDEFSAIPHRLACTATPAPNDLTELGNHAQFLGIMSWREMSATFFVKESNSVNWRLKGHARDDFYRWMSRWSVYIRRPSDIGFDDDGFVLPELLVSDSVVECDTAPTGHLFPTLGSGIQGRIAARKANEGARVERAATILGMTPDEQAIVWCGLNSEGRLLHRRLNGQSVVVEGAMSAEDKWSAARRWLDGDIRVLITKPSIFGFGMNFQHCHRMIFLGLGDSYEQYYQAIRRCWRYGQERSVQADVIISEVEGAVAENVRRKEEQAARIAAGVVGHMKEYETEEVRGTVRDEEDYATKTTEGPGWVMHLGDSAEVLKDQPTDSVGLSVFSPPFVALYTYTATPRDLGNSKDERIFFEHFQYIIKELLRITMPGRNCCVHVSQIPAMLVRDGYIGMRDFRAETVRQFSASGWVYHGEVVIDKDPQAQAIRTHAKGLLFTQLKKDASWLRPALSDYILVFRKPGENAEAIKPDITNENWIEWARPIWYGIRESETLQFRHVRTEKDERHICPLQLGVIERCIRLWSNPGDLVCSPFAGIGSEGYVALQHGRQFLGVELKREYYDAAVQNLRHAARNKRDLFSEVES